MINCGKCTQCCQWGGDLHIRAPLTKKEIKSKKYKHKFSLLAADPITGNCVYLIDGKCSIYEDRPSGCKEFDCRDILNDFESRPFGKIIIAAINKEGRFSAAYSGLLYEESKNGN